MFIEYDKMHKNDKLSLEPWNTIITELEKELYNLIFETRFSE